MNTAPKDIRENVARAKGYLRRDEIPRALDAMSNAVREFAFTSLSKQARTELTVQFEEFLHELNLHPQMQLLLDPERTGTPRKLSFQSGKEKILAVVLEGLNKILINSAEEAKCDAQNTLQQRKNELIETGKSRFLTGDIASGRSFLRRAAAEFGTETGLLLKIGRILFELEQFKDAAEIFENATEYFPKEAEAYAEAVDAYTNALEFEKAENMYLKIFRQFGGHPKTYGRLAKLYLSWGKNSKAADFAHQALQADPEQADAAEVISMLEI